MTVKYRLSSHECKTVSCEFALLDYPGCEARREALEEALPGEPMLAKDPEYRAAEGCPNPTLRAMPVAAATAIRHRAIEIEQTADSARRQWYA